MKFRQCAVTLAVLAAFGTTALVPGAVSAQNKSEQSKRQDKKNNWRNLTGAAAAVAGYGLLKGNKTATVVGAAGAAYSANRYEQERKHQDEGKRARARYYHHNGDYVRNGRKYYKYDGQMYYKDLSTGERHKVN